MSFQTQCPHCSKVLKLKSEAAVGRKAPCPKCKTPFVVEPYEEPAADEWDDAGDEYGYDYSDDDYGDYGDDYEDAEYEEVEPAPSRSSRRSTSKGSKKKTKAAGAPAWLAPAGIGLAVLLGLGLLGGGVMFLVNSFGGGASNAIDLAWLPADADMYLRAKPGEMWDAPILAPLRDNPAIKNAMTQAGQNGQLNLNPEDVDTVTFAGIDLSDQVSARVPLFGGKPRLTGNVVKHADPKHIAVVRLKRDLTTDELASMPGVEKKTHGSAEYFVSGVGNQRAGFHLADARTLLTGTESELTKAIDRGASQDRVARIDFINPNHQLVVAFAPPKVLQPEASTSAGVSPADRLGNSISKGAKAMAFGISLASDIDLQVQFECFDDTSAANIQSEFESVISEAKTKLAQSPDVPEMMQGLMNVATQTLESFQASASGTEVAITGNVPGTLGDEIKKLSENPMAAMMLPMLINSGGTGAGGPGFGGPPADGTFPPDPQQPATSLNEPPPGYVPGGPDAATQADIEALQKEKEGVLDTTGDIRNRIKSGTGSILDSVPGSR